MKERLQNTEALLAVAKAKLMELGHVLNEDLYQENENSKASRASKASKISMDSKDSKDSKDPRDSKYLKYSSKKKFSQTPRIVPKSQRSPKR